MGADRVGRKGVKSGGSELVNKRLSEEVRGMEVRRLTA